VDLLLEAVKLLSEWTDERFVLRLAGKGSLREKLEIQAASLGVKDRVDFLGRLTREDMQLEMQRASCFVLPSRYEAFGVVLIEAMATGLPVIATRSGGPESLVTRDVGLLIESENAADLAAAMLEMVKNLENYSALKIREMTLRRFGERFVMEQYDQLFHHLLDE
jgi:glycosyltransferase involved in cell wall biosynthesis